MRLINHYFKRIKRESVFSFFGKPKRRRKVRAFIIRVRMAARLNYNRVKTVFRAAVKIFANTAFKLFFGFAVKYFLVFKKRYPHRPLFRRLHRLCRLRLRLCRRRLCGCAFGSAALRSACRCTYRLLRTFRRLFICISLFGNAYFGACRLCI